MAIDFLKAVFERAGAADAIAGPGESVYSYRWLLDRVGWLGERITEIPPGSAVILDADYSATSIALFLALVERACIVVPLTPAVAAQRTTFAEIAQVELACSIDDAGIVAIERLPYTATHEHYRQLRAEWHPGLVVFSSGSTGRPKAVVHDVTRLLEKFRKPRPAFRGIAFLQYDHLGGINTLLHILSNGGCLILLNDRAPDTVATTIARHRAELLPASPSFLNLMLLHGAHERFDLSSLRLITYGTEPMSESTLARLRATLPNVVLQQTYGLSELGVLRTKSRESGSLWMKVGGDEFQTRIVDGVLHVRARSAMLGYLNAPSPFTEDGWMDTGDCVETDGEYIRILGRRSEVINVGGEKVHPAEVEGAIEELDNVVEATVFGEPNALMGSIVCARVRLRYEEDPAIFKARLRRHCSERLTRAKVPVKVFITSEQQLGPRGKKLRAAVQ